MIKVSGSVAKEAGFDLERYEAVLGNIIADTRLSGSQVGNALKTVFSRLGRAKTGDASEEEISLAEKAYRQAGIELRNSTDGQFRDIPEVLDQLSSKWKDLTNVQKSYIAEVSAGVRQKNIFLDMMNKWTESTDLYTKALNSNGFAQERQNIYLESTKAKIQQFKTVLETMWQNTISSKGLNSIITMATGVISAIKGIAESFGLLPTIIGIVAASVGMFKDKWALLKVSLDDKGNIQWSGKILNGFKSLGKGIQEFSDNYSKYINQLTLAKNEQLMQPSLLTKMSAAMKSLTSTTIAQTVASGALKVATFALNTALGIGIGLLISWAVTGISNLINKSKEAAQKAQEMQQQIKQEADELNNLESQYTDIIKSGNLTEQSKQQLKSIQDKLISTYDLEAEKLDLVNGKYEDQIKILNNARAKKAEEMLASMGSQGTDAQNKLADKTPLWQFSKEGEKLNKNTIDDLNSVKNFYLSNGYFEAKGTLEERVKALGDAIQKLQSIKNPDKNITGFLNDLTGQYNKLNSELKTNQDILAKYNDAKNTVDFYNQFKDQITEVDTLLAKQNSSDDKEGINKRLLTIKQNMIDTANQSGNLDKFKGLIDDLFIAMENDSNIKDKDAISTEQLAKKQEELTKAFDESTSKIETYNKILSELDSKSGKLSSGTVSNILKNEQDLIPYLGNEVELRNKINQKIAEEEQIQKQTYLNILSNSEEFYNSKIKGNVVTLNAIADLESQYLGGQASAYTADLNNYRTMEQLKLKFSGELIKKLAGAWSQYWVASKGTFSDMFWYSIRYDEKAYAEAMAIVQKMNAAIAALNNISLGDFTLPDFTDINGGTVSTSSTNPEDELKRKQDEAYNIIRTAQEKITAIIKKQVEERKKALDDEYQAYEDEVNKKLKLLDEEEEKNDRRKTLDKEYKKKAELERLIEELKLDTSKEAEIRRKELQAQLDEENSTIADILAKNNKEDQKKNLEDQLEEQRKRIEEQKKLLDEQYSDANIEQMVKNALMSGYLTDLNGKMISLKDAFIEYENIYGEGLGALGDKIKTDLIDNLTKALELMKQLGENGTFNFSVKGSDSVQGSHASGGLVNYTGLGMLHGTSSTPEIVLNNAQATNLFNFIKNPIKPIDLRKYLPALPLPILPKTQLAGAGNMSFDIKNSISVEGNLDKTIVPDLVEKISNYTIEKINNSILFRRR